MSGLTVTLMYFGHTGLVNSWKWAVNTVSINLILIINRWNIKMGYLVISLPQPGS